MDSFALPDGSGSSLAAELVFILVLLFLFCWSVNVLGFVAFCKEGYASFSLVFSRYSCVMLTGQGDSRVYRKKPAKS